LYAQFLSANKRGIVGIVLSHHDPKMQRFLFCCGKSQHGYENSIWAMIKFLVFFMNVFRKAGDF
jgi:hypothetical protein